MRIPIKDLLSNTQYIDQVVWICEYDQHDTTKKPYNHIKPTEGVVITDKYRSILIKPLAKDGVSLLSKTYTIHHHIRVCIYDNREECIDKYKELLNNTIEKFEKYLETNKERLHKLINGANNIKGRGIDS